MSSGRTALRRFALTHEYHAEFEAFLAYLGDLTSAIVPTAIFTAEAPLELALEQHRDHCPLGAYERVKTTPSKWLKDDAAALL